jgi:hypothetical protein
MIQRSRECLSCDGQTDQSGKQARSRLQHRQDSSVHPVQCNNSQDSAQGQHQTASFADQPNASQIQSECHRSIQTQNSGTDFHDLVERLESFKREEHHGVDAEAHWSIVVEGAS